MPFLCFTSHILNDQQLHVARSYCEEQSRGIFPSMQKVLLERTAPWSLLMDSLQRSHVLGENKVL